MNYVLAYFHLMGQEKSFTAARRLRIEGEVTTTNKDHVADLLAVARKASLLSRPLRDEHTRLRELKV